VKGATLQFDAQQQAPRFFIDREPRHQPQYVTPAAHDLKDHSPGKPDRFAGFFVGQQLLVIVALGMSRDATCRCLTLHRIPDREIQ
jgi:hypothetical protein